MLAKLKHCYPFSWQSRILPVLQHILCFWEILNIEERKAGNQFVYWGCTVNLIPHRLQLHTVSTPHKLVTFCNSTFRDPQDSCAEWSSALPRLQIAPADESDARHADPSGSASLRALIWGWLMGKTTLNSSLRPLNCRAENPRRKVAESGPDSPNGRRFPIQLKQRLAEHFRGRRCCDSSRKSLP